MLDRPSTSSGLTTKKSLMVADYFSFPNNSSTTVATAKSRADKRQSKDDLYLVSKSSFPSRFQSFRVTNKGRLPTPDPSPRSGSPMSQEVPIVVRLHTPDSLHAPRGEGSMQSEEDGIGFAVGSPIGMALGSPSHPPAPAAWEDRWPTVPDRQPRPNLFQQHQHQQPQFQLPRTQSPVMSSPGSTNIASPQPTKKAKWKMFGMFGSKKSKYEKGDSKRAKEKQQVQQQLIGSSASIGPYASGAVPARSKTLADRNALRHKPIVVRSNTMGQSSGSGSSTEAWNPPALPQQSTLQVPGLISSTSTLRSTGGRMLDVDIPSVHMERYSIMFSNVLVPPQTSGQPPIPTQPGSASSLLARRHATLDRLKNISDSVEQEVNESDNVAHQPLKVERKPVPAPAPALIQPIRRATSPQPTKSPAFSLFPSTPSSKSRNQTTTKESSDTRNRALTAPSILPSPSNESFNLGALRKEAFNNSQVSLVVPKTITTSPVSTRGRVNEFPPPKQSFTRAYTTPSPLASAPIVTATTSTTISSNPKANDSSLSVATTASKFTPEQSNLVLDSPTSISSTASDAADVIQTGPLKPVLNEPLWKLVSPPPSNNSADTATTAATSITASPPTSVESTSTVTTSNDNRKRSPSAASGSSVKTHMTQPSVMSIDEEDTALKAAVEISIARQISISRQQRNLLRPLKTNGPGGLRRYNTVGSSPGRSPAAPSSAVYLAEDEKLSETNSSTPVLVHPEESLHVTQASMKGHQYKKSEKIVIEGY
ncbi:hypothetical protein MKZ38_006574 [Zalerion maritima]|uniref:Uncharacterized protein n=1 Tax=Zalerion maritima TaxID=339359 RepID=A0AAD5RJG0_9PEZI|nr:hypothetical protein MKZ38_006574 [Zalerion maritima]